MVDRAARKKLSLHVRQVVTGRISRDDFYDLVDREYASANDRAVSESVEFLVELFNGDACRSYRLRGRNAVAGEIRRTAARSVLFLRSDLEYAWPPLSGLAGGIAFLAFLLATALAIVSVPLLLEGDGVSSLLFGLPGLAIFVVGAACSLGQAAANRQWRQSGDYDVFPFLWREDFDRACKTLHLLGRPSQRPG